MNVRATRALDIVAGWAIREGLRTRLKLGLKKGSRIRGSSS